MQMVEEPRPQSNLATSKSIAVLKDVSFAQGNYSTFKTDVSQSQEHTKK